MSTFVIGTEGMVAQFVRSHIIIRKRSFVGESRTEVAMCVTSSVRPTSYKVIGERSNHQGLAVNFEKLTRSVVNGGDKPLSVLYLELELYISFWISVCTYTCYLDNMHLALK